MLGVPKRVHRRDDTFDTKVFYERPAAASKAPAAPFLIRVKASPSIKINRVDAARQVASLGHRKVASSFEFQAPSKNLVKLRRRSTR